MRFCLLAEEDLKELSWIEQCQGPGFNWSLSSVRPFVFSRQVWGLVSNEASGVGNSKLQILAALCGRSLPGGIFEVLWLATHPDCRNQGHMKRLLGDLANASRHISEIWLEVHEENLAAIKFYRAFGFFQVGVRPRYYPDQKACLLMSLKVNPPS